jgi:hypothetical protein
VTRPAAGRAACRRRRAGALGVALALAAAPARFATAQDGGEGGAGPRDRFEEGLARFRANDMGGAVALWTPIVEQLGDERAYRLLFNLGVAHEALGDATGAADHYERFLARVEARASAGAGGAPADVLSFRDEARRRLAALKAKYGRVRVASERGVLVAVRVGGASGPSGRTYYVAPGAHDVVLRAGAAEGEERRRVVLRAGELVEVAPRPSPGEAARVVVVSAPPPPPREPPYSPWVVAAAGGVTIASLVVPLLARGAAVAVAERYYDPLTPVGERAAVAADYEGARARYAWSWALPGALGAGTGALAAYYFFGARPRRAAAGVGFGGPAGALGLSFGGTFGE